MHNVAEIPGTPITHHEDMTHQQVVFAADSLRTTATLIAPTEGHARFVAMSAAVTSERRRGIPGALARLGAQCGYGVTEAMATAAVVSGPPIRIAVVGERSDADAAALDAIVRFGIAEIAASPVAPPRRPERDATWFQPAITALGDGQTEALLIIIPPGALLLWVAQILTGIGEAASVGGARCLALTSDAALADVMPGGADLLVRDDLLVAHLTYTLNRIRAGYLLPGLPTGTPILSRPEAIVAATRAMRADEKKACVYLDVSDGTTVIVADAGAVIVHHQSEIDCSHGAVALLQRCGPERITRWVPFPIEERALRTWAVHRASSPLKALVTQEDRRIAAAFARAALCQVMEATGTRVPNKAQWVIGHALARLGPPSDAVRLVADLLPASGIAAVICDRDDLFASIGALSFTHPEDAADLLRQDGCITAGTVIQAAPSNHRRGDRGHVTLVTDGRTQSFEVAPNALTTISCHGMATVTLPGITASDDRIAVHGGVAGIVIDTRQRPVDAASSDLDRPTVSERLRSSSIPEGAANGR